jgi:hypothetical protein
MIDMTALWRAAGRPRNHSPRRWLVGRPHFQARVVDLGGGPDAPVLADTGTALIYAAISLDKSGTLMEAWDAVRKGGLLASAARALAHDDAGITALMMKSYLIAEGISDAEAGQYLVDQAKHQVAAEGLDPYAEETRVAKARRAVVESKFGEDGNQ